MDLPRGICWSGFTNGFAGADPQVWIGVDLPEWICPRGFTGGVAAVNLTKVDLLVWICWSGFARGEFAGVNPEGRIGWCGFAGIRRRWSTGVDLPAWICWRGFTEMDSLVWIRRGGLEWICRGGFAKGDSPEESPEWIDGCGLAGADLLEWIYWNEFAGVEF